MQGVADIVPLDEERTRRASAEPPHEAALSTAGGMLRAARQNRALSLEDVSRAINIKPERLAAIEAMDKDALPAAPYALGFVRSYANHLDLPADPMVARFREQAGYAQAPRVKRVKAPLSKDLGASREVPLFGVLLVLGFLGWFAWRIVLTQVPETPVELEGFPIADRTETQQVTYEVGTSLAADEESAAAEAPGTTTEAEAAPAAPEQTPAVGEDLPIAAAAQSGSDQLVLNSAPADMEAAAEQPLDTEAPVPADPAPSAADLLNERLLAELQEQDDAGEPADGGEQGVAADLPPLAAAEPVEEIAIRPAPAPEPVRVEPARLTSPVSPVYPSRCETGAAAEEVVTVEFAVSRFGRVTRPAVAETTNRCFNSAALAAVSRFAFEPAMQGERAVASNGRTTRIVFRRP